MKKHKLLILGTFAMDTFDAELIHFSSIIKGLKHLGNNVSVFHLSLQNKPAITQLFPPDIDFHEIFVSSQTNSGMFIKGVLLTPKFLCFLAIHRPEILYARLGIVSGMYVIATKLLFGKKIKIITEHNGWIGPEALSSGKPKFLAFIGKQIQKWSAIFSDRVRAVSEGVQSYLISLGAPPERIVVIGNGTDASHFKPLDRKSMYDIGFVGNLATWQGIDWLIEAFALVVREKPEATLAIAGSGPQEQSIKAHIDSLQLGDHISLLGNIPYKEVPNVINSYKICVAPFKPRGTGADNKALSPLKIRDYAACGKPIIASDIPGLEEIGREGFGILVQPGDINALANATLELLNNPELCHTMGQKARMYAEHHYSWDNVTTQISNQIERIVAEKNCNPDRTSFYSGKGSDR
ncbi:MAG: glycosyltransferase family 4 protein [Deltaproteobacteria bacterium]|nr:glycosyltransferase family 4 protein [Deltaproteobacteria bacterium]